VIALTVDKREKRERQKNVKVKTISRVIFDDHLLESALRRGGATSG
jgi:hypothetical protein